VRRRLASRRPFSPSFAASCLDSICHYDTGCPRPMLPYPYPITYRPPPSPRPSAFTHDKSIPTVSGQSNPIQGINSTSITLIHLESTEKSFETLLLNQRTAGDWTDRSHTFLGARLSRGLIIREAISRNDNSTRSPGARSFVSGKCLMNRGRRTGHQSTSRLGHQHRQPPQGLRLAAIYGRFETDLKDDKQRFRAVPCRSRRKSCAAPRDPD
jgi:hypothetical protein